MYCIRKLEAEKDGIETEECDTPCVIPVIIENGQVKSGFSACGNFREGNPP